MKEVEEKKKRYAESSEEVKKKKKATSGNRFSDVVSGMMQRSPYALDEDEMLPGMEENEPAAPNPFVLTEEEQQQIAQTQKEAPEKQKKETKRKKKTSGNGRFNKAVSAMMQRSPYALDEEEMQQEIKEDASTTAESDEPAEESLPIPETKSEIPEQSANESSVPELTEEHPQPEVSTALQAKEVKQEADNLPEESVQVTNRPKRRHKRRWYGVPMGMIVLILATIGFGWLCWQGGQYLYGVITDDSAERAYDDYLNSVVMFDPEPFESLNAADKGMIQRAAVWEAVFDNIKEITNYDNQARLIVPAQLVHEAAARLFGVDCLLTPESFSMEGSELSVEYMESTDSYHVPILQSVGTYRPYTVSIQNITGGKRLRVAYCVQIEVGSDGEMPEIDTEIVGGNLAVVKYMEYELGHDNDTGLDYIVAIRQAEE